MNDQPSGEPEPVGIGSCGSAPTARTVSAVREALSRLQAATVGVTDDQLRAPSALPGWTRGHVLAHLLSFSRGARRQVDSALRGELVEFYDAGREGRGREIEANAPRPASELVHELRTTVDELLAAWARPAPPDWDRRVTYRAGTLVDVLHCCWREAEIHLVDLDLGARPSSCPRSSAGMRSASSPRGHRRAFGSS